MQITKINIDKYTKEDILENRLGRNILANVSIIIDHDMMINNIKLMNGDKGRYLKFPIDNVGRNIAFPIKDDIRQLILESVIKEYDKD